MHASVQYTARLAQLHGLSRVNAVCCFDSECPIKSFHMVLIDTAMSSPPCCGHSRARCQRRRPQHQFHPGINVVAFVYREPGSGSEQRPFLLEESQWLCKLAIEEDHKEELNCSNLCFPRFPAVFFLMPNAHLKKKVRQSLKLNGNSTQLMNTLGTVHLFTMPCPGEDPKDPTHLEVASTFSLQGTFPRWGHIQQPWMFPHWGCSHLQL